MANGSNARPREEWMPQYGRVWSDKYGCWKDFISEAPIKRGKYKATHVWVYMIVYPEATWVRVPKRRITRISLQLDIAPIKGQKKTYTVDGF